MSLCVSNNLSEVIWSHLSHEANPGHHLVSPYSRNLIFETGVGMNLQSYQCSFSN